MESLKQVESDNPSTSASKCSIGRASVRKDWYYMSKKERKDYISAVQCITKLPPHSDPNEVPGAKTRYDDFVAQHINQTFTSHGTGNFLGFHRYYIYGYEKALREECGYQGSQPYWNWFAYQNNLKDSPVFDGSETSMGGDGSFVQHNGSVGGIGYIIMPSGEGGGCIKSGPLKGLQVNLGPLLPSMDGEIKAPSFFAYNPRCLKRDLTNYASSNWLTLSNLYNVTLGDASRSIGLFQNEVQGRFSDGFLGMHAAGHFAINGDAGDFYASPNDPVFWMHHAMLDRLWWIWQALHLEQARTVEGTITLNNKPPSRNATLEDLLHFNYLGLEDIELGKMMNTLGGDPLCYIYA
ncbi:hypothetical protein BKA70DRAFT_1146360 [Coprinopsis sp. MPI-PUGE-AT-0042]|nr:hypothetical protein BKA70DRAFT_1146360 [Coprinopsis sp. MPI-PUGE-AT-0042]